MEENKIRHNLDLSSTAAPFSIKNRQLVQR
jgi:hypothetical protein